MSRAARAHSHEVRTGSPALRWYLLCALLLGVSYFAVGTVAVQVTAWLVIALSSAAAVVLGVRLHRPSRPLPWVLFAIGQFAFAIGDVIYYSYDRGIGDEVPVPSLADACYLPMYGFLATGLLIFARRRSSGDDRAALLDALIVTVGLGLLSWVFLVEPYLADHSVAVGTRLTSVAYPLGDVLVLAVAARLWSSRGVRSRSFQLLAASLSALLAADTLYALIQIGHDARLQPAVDVAWLLYFVCFGAAALHPSMRELDSPAPDTSVRITNLRITILLGVASLLTPFVLVTRGTGVRGGDVHLMATISVLLFALVALRTRDLVQTLRRMHERQSEGRFQRLTQHVYDVITIADSDALIQYVTPSVEPLLGWTPEELHGAPLRGVVHPDDAARVMGVLTGLREGGPAAPIECRLRRRDDAWVVAETIGTWVDDEGLRGYLLTTRDVTERKSLEEQLTHQAFHDSLTGLANRALFVDRVRHALKRRHELSRHIAVLVLDLDDFHTINDSLGHLAGNELLRAVANRLRNTLRSADTVARLGGDEFGLLLEAAATSTEAAQVAERVLDALRPPFTLCGRQVVAHASVGIALADPDRAQDAEELLRDADVAMYTAKRKGKGRYDYFAPSMYTGLVRKLDLTADLRVAIEQDELLVYYQPIVDLTDGQVVGAEALVRWQRPGVGMVSPADFVPIAEETGLILPLGYKVLAEACARAALWHRSQPAAISVRPLSVSVNLSPRQVQDVDLLSHVEQVLEGTRLPPESLTLEITESVLSDDGDMAAVRLRQLKDLGVLLAVDDFGTGYSSLSRLQHFPIDILKIPKPFVDGVSHGDERSALARAIVDLSSALRLRVVAEGIEHHDQWQALHQLGCHLGQGFYFARPVPAADLEPLLARGILAERQGA